MFLGRCPGVKVASSVRHQDCDLRQKTVRKLRDSQSTDQDLFEIVVIRGCVLLLVYLAVQSLCLYYELLKYCSLDVW